MHLNRIYSALVVLSIIATQSISAKTYYVSLSGNDSNPGTIDSTFQTISKSINSVSAGDTIYVRGGTYILGSTITVSPKSGTDTTLRCCLLAYPGERPLLDFSSMTGTSADGLKISGSYWYVKGFDCKGAPHNGIVINAGRYNIVEFCSSSENRNTGVQLKSGASYNRIINCDSYFNFDAPLGGNADGFSPKLDVGTGNYFYGCRSWQNSDDGWDGYLRPADSVSTTLENCWSFMNGYLKDGNPIASGNGNGFKMGGGDNSNADSLRHDMTLIHCLAFDNRVKGFDQNNNRGSMTLLNCTSYRNGSNNFSISGPIRSTSTVTVENCAELGGKIALGSYAILLTDSWLNPPFAAVTDADFESLDTTGVRGSRKADGSLPDVPFMHLAPGSQLIDRGTDIGLPYNGSAPDVGAFESGTPSAIAVVNTSMPASFGVSQNYPNPFNPSTTFTVEIPKSGAITVRVFDVAGRLLRTLADGYRAAGRYAITWDGSGVNHAPASSGVYIARVQYGTSVKSVKLLLMK